MRFKYETEGERETALEKSLDLKIDKEKEGFCETKKWKSSRQKTGERFHGGVDHKKSPYQETRKRKNQE